MGILDIKGTIKEYGKLICICPTYYKILSSLRKNKDSRIILIGTPAHGNLGDQAIAISEIDFLKKIADDRLVIEIPMPLYKSHRSTVKKYIHEQDIIIISGGGWMGNLWIHNEYTIRDIISDFINNKIIIFPQTLFYSNDDVGRKTLIETKKLFGMHEKLILTVRDEKSFECAKYGLKMKSGKNLFFCPDMVAYGTLSKELLVEPKQKIALTCLRNDIEKVLDNNDINDVLERHGYIVRTTTTVLNRLVPINQRRRIVENKIVEFQEASIVITDRLHAMLFAVLSGTPCIALNNVTGKVFGVGTYLKSNGASLEMVEMVDDQILGDFHLKKKQYKLCDELKSYFVQLGRLVNDEEMV